MRTRELKCRRLVVETIETHAGGTPAISGMTSAELTVLDGITAGTGLASKAVVLDSGGDFMMPTTGLFGMSRGTLAATGSGASTAAVITQQVTAVTASDGTKAVALPAAATTVGPLLVINTVLTTGATLPVYPVNAGNDNINGGAEDAAFTLGPGKAAWFIPTSATQWYAEDASATTAITSELNFLAGATAGTQVASKAVIADANVNTGVAKVTALHIGATGAETQVVATAAEINTACDQSAQVMAPGAGISAGVGTVYKSSVVKQGDIFKTTIFLDLTGLSGTATDTDIIGTAGVCHLGQITAAKNGTIFYGQVTCLETPAGGPDDVVFYSADEATGAYDGLVTDLTETVLYDKTSAAAAAAATQIALAAVPAANQYLYLAAGEGAAAGEYSAGQFLIELYGA